MLRTASTLLPNSIVSNVSPVSPVGANVATIHVVAKPSASSPELDSDGIFTKLYHSNNYDQPLKPRHKRVVNMKKQVMGSKYVLEATEEVSTGATPVNTANVTYLSENILADFISIACDGTGQYVGAISDYPTTLYLSNNYGTTFIAYEQYYSFNNDVLTDIAIASQAPSIVAVSGNQGIYYTTTFGSTVSKSIFPTPSVYACQGITLSSDATYAYTVCIVSGMLANQAQVFVSKDSLQTFDLLSTSVKNDYMDITTSMNGQYVYAVAQSPDAFYVSKDFGNTFTNMTSFKDPTAVTCSSTGEYVAIGVESGRLVVSSDYGATWNISKLNTAAKQDWKDVSMSASGQYIAAVADGPSVYLSSNYGKLFTLSDSSAQSWSSVAISGNDGSSIYAIAPDSHIFKSTDSGTTWSPLYYEWYGVATSQSGSTRVVVNTNYYNPAVFMTNDDAATWSLQTAPITALPYGTWFATACNNNCSQIVVTTWDNDLILSHNYGQTWTVTSLSIPDLVDDNNNDFVVVDVAMSSTGQYVTILANTGPIFMSSNFGKNFSMVGTTHNYWSVAMSSSGALQLATSIAYSFYSTAEATGYVFMSTDYGSNWNVISGLPASDYWSAVSSDAAGVNLVAAQCYGGSIYYSQDSGVTWQNSHFSATCFVALCQSADGAKVYAANGGGMFLVAEGFIYVSSDHGKTWNVTGAPSKQWGQLACDETGQSITATVLNGQVFTSSDFGMTWSPQNLTIPSRVIDVTDDDAVPSAAPTALPTLLPTASPTIASTISPTASPTIVPTTSPTLNPTSSSGSNSNSQLSGGAIAGITIGVLAFLLMLGGAMFLFATGATLFGFSFNGSAPLATQSNSDDATGL